jgi:HAD superfamily hydrolase (TIGR01490 family)
MNRTLGLFDFDGTLTKCDTFIKFAIFAAGRARFTIALLLASPWLVKWKLNLITSSEAKEKLFGLLFKGISESKFNEKCSNFAAIIERHLNSEVFNKMQTMQQNDARIVITSASIKNWIAPWASQHGVCDIIATKAEVVNGRLTGRFLTKNCVREEKVNRILKAIPDIEKYEVYVFGNMPDDAAMFALAEDNHVCIVR